MNIHYKDASISLKYKEKHFTALEQKNKTLQVFLFSHKMTVRERFLSPFDPFFNTWNCNFYHGCIKRPLHCNALCRVGYIRPANFFKPIIEKRILVKWWKRWIIKNKMNKSPESSNIAKISNFHKRSLSCINTVFLIKFVFPHIHLYYKRSQQIKILGYREGHCRKITNAQKSFFFIT